VRVGVLKPDHLGDLILAAPAVAALLRRFDDLTLFCHPNSLALARHLFPEGRSLPIHLPHLDKDRGIGPGPQARLKTLRDEIDLLICLRWDGQCERLLTIPEIEYHIPGPADSDRHVTVDHRELVQAFTGPYDILESYRYPGCPAIAAPPRELRAVGLCVSAGYRLNAWPMNHWLRLARLLSRRGSEIVLIGGPAEVGCLTVLGEAMRTTLGYRPGFIVGDDDFKTTLERLSTETDLVVATDSGAAHLAALVRPVVSLFGGSPWRRFAPLGPFNMILTRRYRCSPCVQFNRAVVNTCHAQECLTNLMPEQVHACLTAYLQGLDVCREVQLDGVWMAQAPWTRDANPYMRAADIGLSLAANLKG
jgi:ADP-heptose:LPS heptosyltransferase